jgi:hypothetical protein
VDIPPWNRQRRFPGTTHDASWLVFPAYSSSTVTAYETAYKAVVS